MLDKCVSDYLLFKVNHVLHRGIKNSPHIPWLHKMSSYAWSLFRASLVAQMVKNEPAMQETWVQSLCQEIPLEEGMATQSSILAWRFPWTEEPGEFIGHKESDTTEAT